MPLRTCFALLSLILLFGCAASGKRGNDDLRNFQNQYSGGSVNVEDLNQQLLTLAVQNDASDDLYRLGPGDEITVDVFGVEELSGNYRVDGLGRISMPLIGSVEVSGYTLSETEELLEQRYGEDYLRNPQITVAVVEFRSQQFTAVGAVAQPRVYNTQRKITLIEALAMAGGLAPNAGSYVHVTDRIRDPETGRLGMRSVAVSIDDLTRGLPEANLVLGEAALINVPPAGSVFVEGAVQRPGVFQQRGSITVLKAIAMAGGLKFEADRNQISVLRRNPATNEWLRQSVSFNEIRESPANDIELQDGDIVVVEAGALRSAWTGLWETVSRVVMLGFRPLGP
ncbi:MAG: hypothetical protein Kow0020_14230 [Wenzhouxiangellaceae bacterium]